MEVEFEKAVADTMMMIHAIYRTIKNEDNEESAHEFVWAMVENCCVDDLISSMNEKYGKPLVDATGVEN